MEASVVVGIFVAFVIAIIWLAVLHAEVKFQKECVQRREQWIAEKDEIIDSESEENHKLRMQLNEVRRVVFKDE